MGVIKEKRSYAFSDEWIFDLYNFSCKSRWAYSNPIFAKDNSAIRNTQPLKGHDDEYEEDLGTAPSASEQMVSLGELGVSKCGVHPEFLF